MAKASRKGKPSARHSAEVKAAVIASLLAGQGVDEVAKQYNLPYHTVYRWHNGLNVEEVKASESKRTDEIGLMLMSYLRETLTTLKAQAIYFRNETWLSKQSASEVGVLHGIQADKSIRLLEAIERANAEAGEASKVS